MMQIAKALLLWTVFALLPQNVQADLLAHAELDQSGQDFNYTLFNDEPVGSSNYISIWHLTVNAPFEVTSTPANWDYFTDNFTFVDWFNTEFELPYPSDVAPGASLGGFVITSAVTTTEQQIYTIGSWDHTNDAGGPGFEGLTLAPSGIAAVPEPSSLILLLTGFGLGGIHFLREKRDRCSSL